MTRRLFGLCQDFVHLVTSVSRFCALMRFVHFVYSVGLLYVQCSPSICALDCKCKDLCFLMICFRFKCRSFSRIMRCARQIERIKNEERQVERGATYKLLFAIHLLMAFVCNQLTKSLPFEIDFLGVDRFFFSMIFQSP